MRRSSPRPLSSATLLSVAPVLSVTSVLLLWSAVAPRPESGSRSSRQLAVHVAIEPAAAASAVAESVPWGAAPDTRSPFDHSAFDRLLENHVDREGLVDYRAFDRDSAFHAYLERLAGADPAGMREAERLALWINAYNAWTIRLINREGRPGSIRDINKILGLISGGGAWRVRFAEVAGQTWTLDEIEHEIIREGFDDPRIHFALGCAALGCPPLRREAYTGEELHRQLDDQARRFLLESPHKNRVSVEDGRLWLSPIFDWYEDDFGGSDDSVVRYVAKYLPPGRERDLLLSGDVDIEYTDYDWSLNDQR